MLEKCIFKKRAYGCDIINKNSWMSVRKTRGETVHLGQFMYQEPLWSLKIIIRYIFINVAHASNISELHLVINRSRIPPETTLEPPRQQDNPYIFKPKSYSSRRSIVPEIPEKQLRSSPSKKVKRQNLKNKEPSPQFRCDIEAIKSQLHKEKKNYFGESFFVREKNESEKGSQTIIHQEPNDSKKLNPMMKNEITIVSNKNQKISVLIHEALLLANTSHAKIGKDQHFLKGVDNPFDYQKRTFYLKNIKFEKDYKSGYAPIEMQLKNSQEPDEVNNNESSKTHFIRKKQSTLSLPRSCGVSYIKPTESTQGHPFQPLPPLIFQCSSRCQSTGNKYQQLSAIFNLYSQSCWLPFIQTTQDDMRDLLLGKKIGQVGWVKGIHNLWPLFGESTFFLIQYPIEQCLTENDIWKAFGQCPFKIGVLAKKSTSGKKAFLKSLNIKESGATQQEGKEQKISDVQQKNSLTQNELVSRHSKQTFQQSKTASLEEALANQLKDCRTVITLSLRLQMYVEEKQWKSSSKETKDMLNYLITNLKDALEKNLLNIIQKRLTLSKEPHNSILIEQAISNLRVASEQSIYEGLKLKQSIIQLNQSQLKSLLKTRMINNNQCLLMSKTKNMSLQQIHKMNKTEMGWQKNLKMPLYYISTRDSFAFDLIEKITYHKRDNRVYKKIEYYFEAENLPTNYGRQYKQRFPNLDVGITCYHDFFTNQQLEYFQKNTFQTETNAFKNKFLQMTVQPSIVGSKIKRTKFFFGYRYMWTRCQIAEPGSYVGAGVRRDVTQAPKWTQSVIDELVKSQIAEENFINSIAINVYHDGKQGLAQHFDDAVRFKQPIYTLRLFSDARLSFGSQFYGFCNGAFIIPLPRGCICVMQENSYAANGVKHCVRPCDMTGKSCAVILRQMHHKVVSESRKYDQLIDFPAWVSCLSSSPEAVSFAQQKRREAEYLLNNCHKDEVEK